MALSIPSFLRRKPGAAIIPDATPQPPPAAKGPPVSPDPRFPEIYEINLPDLHRKELLFGCGMRWVIAKVGHRWVYLKPYSLHQYHRRHKLARTDWDALVRAQEAANRRLGTARPVRLDAGGLLEASGAADDHDPEPADAAAPARPGKRRAPAAAGAAPPSPRGYWGEAAAMAGHGKVPPPPDFSAETHKRYRAKLAEVAALAQAGNRAALEAWTIKTSSSSPKAILRYRDICLVALQKK